MNTHDRTQEVSDPISVRLGAERLCKSYGDVQANADISLSVRPGEIHAIVGENGAGKSTLMRILQGIEQPDSGQIIVDDCAVSLAHPQQAFDLGIGMVHQEFMLAPDLTLLENLVLGDEPVTRAFGVFSRIDWASALRSGEELADQTGVEIDWSRKAGGAPVHVQQFVEIIKLLRRGARILILDEPTAVLAPQQVEHLFTLLGKLRAGGTTIVFISHKLREVMEIADRVTVIRRGKVCFTSPVSETDPETLAGHMIGVRKLKGMATDTRVQRRSPSSEILFGAHDLKTPSVNKSHALNGVDIEIGAGELVGIAGVSGNGQSELVECLVGLRAVEDGTIFLAGSDITHSTNRQRRALGMGYISADRHNEGLALATSIEVNVIAGSHRKSPICDNGIILDLKAMGETARERLEFLDVRYGTLSDPVSSLSGGNQQRLVFAREIAASPTLLIVSQPTRGVDLQGIAAIHKILGDFCARGGAVLLISEELDEILDLSDRIYVMAEGEIVGQMSAADADIGKIGRMMLMQGGADG